MTFITLHLPLGPQEKFAFSFCPNAAGVNSLGDGKGSESLQEDNAWEDRFKLNNKADFISLLGNKLTGDFVIHF